MNDISLISKIDPCMSTERFEWLEIPEEPTKRKQKADAAPDDHGQALSPSAIGWMRRRRPFVFVAAIATMSISI